MRFLPTLSIPMLAGTLAALPLCLPATLAMAGACPPDVAEYRLTFDATWSATSHPTDFPSNPHFSGLVGGVHGQTVSFWQIGQLASTGIEQMAELGSKTALINEVNTAIAAGNAESVVSGNGIGRSPGSVSVDFAVSQSYPLATIVTMLAPSPDWFVGVSGQALFQNGNWVDQVIVDLYPYDAGTDSGASYTSPDADTNPAEPIAQITGFPFLNGDELGIVGTFRFDLLSATCIDTDADGVSDDADNCILLANADQRDTDGDSIGNLCDPDIAPASNDCVVNFLDLNGLRSAFFSVPASPNWNPDADFNGDGSVSFLDGLSMRELFLMAPGPSASGCN